jgi:hypothetical protein
MMARLDGSDSMHARAHAAGERQEGSRAARLLHMVRRAERGMLSYDRTGWLEDEPCRPTGWGLSFRL